MKQMVSLRLFPSPDQQQALLDLLHAWNAACAYIASEAQAAEARDVFVLQARTTGTLLEDFQLPMALALRAVLVVAQAHPAEHQARFSRDAAIPLDEQLVRFEGLTRLSIFTLRGRLRVAFCVQETRRAPDTARLGQVFLHAGAGKLWLTVILSTTRSERTVVSPPASVV
jgi:hypothetical protein